MANDFQQLAWDDQLRDDCRELVRLALAEDLGGQQDWTTVAIVPADRRGAADVMTREAGVVAGLPALDVVIEAAQAAIDVTNFAEDGQQVEVGTRLATLTGNARDLLTCERTMLNLLSRLMGIATLTQEYVDQTADTSTKIYDTRKTTPGWRRLEKYAVRCGGGHNHRTGLFDAVLIKDNHLAQSGMEGCSLSDAVRQARNLIESTEELCADRMPIEIEVDTLEQFQEVLPVKPDIVLLDNMPPVQLTEAVSLRNEIAPTVILEASGGVSLATLPEIVATGVDRISVGGLTHSARSLDIGLDWQSH